MKYFILALLCINSVYANSIYSLENLSIGISEQQSLGNQKIIPGPQIKYCMGSNKTASVSFGSLDKNLQYKQSLQFNMNFRF